MRLFRCPPQKKSRHERSGYRAGQGQDNLAQSIDLEMLHLDNFAPLAHNELVLHPTGTTLRAGYEGEHLSSFPAAPVAER